MEQSFAAVAEVDYRQPFDNDNAFYRCVTESMVYLLRRKGFTSERVEQVMFGASHFWKNIQAHLEKFEVKQLEMVQSSTSLAQKKNQHSKTAASPV